MVRFKPFSINYRTDEGNLVVDLWGRDEYGNRRHVELHDTTPYFYSDEPVHHSYVNGIDHEAGQTLQDETVHRIKTRFPYDVPKAREQAERTWEADVTFAERIRYDHGIKDVIAIPDEDTITPEDITPTEDVDGPEIDPRVCVFDIEVSDKKGFASEEAPTAPVISISAWDSYNDSYLCILRGDLNQDEKRKAMMHFRDEGWKVKIIKVQNEEKLFAGFTKFVEQVGFDIIAGWNSSRMACKKLARDDNFETEGYDVPYLRNRADAQGYAQPNWSALAEFDLMDGFKYQQFTDLRAHGLDYVAQTFGLEGKSTDDRVHKLYDRRRGELVIYNVTDVFLTKEIMQRAGLLDFYVELAAIAGTGLENTLSAGRVVDAYTFHRLRDTNAVQPTKRRSPEYEVEGGHVEEAADGIFRNVIEIDFSSEYPSVMRTFNISPDTKVGEDYEGETFDLPNASYRKEPRGFYPEVLDELIELRYEKRAQGRDLEERVVKAIMNCYTGDHEVLTPDRGPVNIKDIDVGDEVYSVNLGTGETEIKSVTETYDYEYDGEMHRYETSQMDFIVTPNHRIVVGSQRDEHAHQMNFWKSEDITERKRRITPARPQGGERVDEYVINRSTHICKDQNIVYANFLQGHTTRFEIAENSNLPKKRVDAVVSELLDADILSQDQPEGHGEAKNAQLSEGPRDFSTTEEVRAGPKHNHIPRRYVMEDWLRLMAWYITEGSIVDNTSDGISIAQGGERRQDIRNLLERMGFPWTEKQNKRGVSYFNIHSTVLKDELVDLCGRGSHDISFPEWVLGLSAEQREVFLETLMAGDGDEDQPRYSTASEALKDRVMSLSVSLGRKVKETRDSGVYRIWHRDDAYCTFDPKAHKITLNENPDPDGKVYCVTVEDNNTVMAGRNGLFQWCGQSVYGNLSSPYFRNSDPEMGNDITAMSRRHLKFTKEWVRDRGNIIVYGDTDSVHFMLPGNVSYEEAKKRGEELVEQLNEEFRGFAEEYGWAEDDSFHLEIEVEQVAERFIQSGSKKRYALAYRDPSDDYDIRYEGTRYSLGVKGFEIRRSDAAPLTEAIQEEAMEKVMFGEQPGEALVSYLSDVLKSLKGGDIPVERAAIPHALNKPIDAYETTHPRTRAPKFSNKHLGTRFTDGDKPWVLFGDVGGVRESTDCIAIEPDGEAPDDFNPDWDKIIERTIRKPMEPLLDLAGKRWKDVTHPTNDVEEFL